MIEHASPMTWAWLLSRWHTLFDESTSYSVLGATFTVQAVRSDKLNPTEVSCWDFYDLDGVKRFGVFFGGLPPTVFAYAEHTGTLTPCDLTFDEIEAQ